MTLASPLNATSSCVYTRQKSHAIYISKEVYSTLLRLMIPSVVGDVSFLGLAKQPGMPATPTETLNKTSFEEKRLLFDTYKEKFSLYACHWRVSCLLV